MAYILCYSSSCAHSLLSISLGPHLLGSALSDDFSEINQIPLKIQAESCKPGNLRGKNQINPPSTTGRTRKKGALFSLDPVSTRRTEIERRGGGRNGHLCLSLPPLSLSISTSLWFLMFGFWSRGDGWDGWSYLTSQCCSLPRFKYCWC
ncbi:hypothetical protein BAE44_0012708 [Dichanthelium oligosanthes]|uniref:Uncharacterized protein n=1 Tax=Dichanthelium oligosanthes TaxID=888268 RepID=A0A1E5VMC0_9POAL|nr:hypothetical protein BAE44_0012708 [Dichanthelium oligosanthes]